MPQTEEQKIPNEKGQKNKQRYRKLKIEQYEPHQNLQVNSGAPDGLNVIG